MRIEQQVQSLLFPRGEFVLGQRFEEFRADRDHAAQGTELALGTDGAIRDQLGDWMLAARQYDFLSRLNASEELRLRVVFAVWMVTVSIYAS